MDEVSAWLKVIEDVISLVATAFASPEGQAVLTDIEQLLGLSTPSTPPQTGAQAGQQPSAQQGWKSS